MWKSQISTHSHSSIYGCLRDQQRNYRKSLPPRISSSTISSSPVCGLIVHSSEHKHLNHRCDDSNFYINNAFTDRSLNENDENTNNIQYSKIRVKHNSTLKQLSITKSSMSPSSSKSSFFNLGTTNVISGFSFKCSTPEDKKNSSVIAEKDQKIKSVNFSPQISFSQESKNHYRWQSQERVGMTPKTFKGKNFSRSEMLKCFFAFYNLILASECDIPCIF